MAESGAPHGLLVVAECQTMGKGRRGRSWVSPPGANIFMSLLLRPEIEPTDASMLTLVAAMAVTDGIRKVTGLETGIKWPNDVVIDGKKVCGCLLYTSQARERTQVIMDLANKVNGMVVGTGDMSELALGWATYNGDHMSKMCIRDRSM